MKLENYLNEKRTYPRFLTRQGSGSPTEFGNKIQTYPELQKIAKDTIEYAKKNILVSCLSNERV